MGFLPLIYHIFIREVNLTSCKNCIWKEQCEAIEPCEYYTPYDFESDCTDYLEDLYDRQEYYITHIVEGGFEDD